MIYNISDATYSPTCQVCDWKIVDLIDKHGNITQHLVGEDEDGGRVSTPIVKQTEDIYVTTSGRVYTVIGREATSISSDVRYVLSGYKYTNKLEEINVN